MDIYHYDTASGEYLGAGVALEDPLVPGTHPLPAHSTAVQPPAAQEGHTSVWDGVEWQSVEDHRGASGWLADGTPHIVTALGPLPDGWSEVAPPLTAERLRAKLLAEIGARKNALRDGGFLVDGVLWDSDAGARLAYAELAQRLAADPSFTTRWKASEGQWVTMTAALFAAVYTAGAAHIAAAFAWQEAEEARLAATPDEELSEFVISPAEES